jgi:outer membrane biosynthesis protein TonB
MVLNTQPVSTSQSINAQTVITNLFPQNVNVSHHLSVTVTSACSPTNCHQHHLCVPALATATFTAAHHPQSPSLTRSPTTCTVPPSPATAQSTSPATQHPTPRPPQASHPTPPPSTPPNSSKCTTPAHQPLPPSSPRHQHQHRRCPPSSCKPNPSSPSRNLTRPSSPPSPPPGSTTTTSRPQLLLLTSRTTTAISAALATRLSRGLLRCASTPTRTRARSLSAARMPAVGRRSLCAAI